MGRKIRRIIMLLLLLICLGSAGTAAYTIIQYRASEKLYSETSNQYTVQATETPEASAEEADENKPPITVDFDALRQVNEDVAGWIYCEGTVINYPVVQGEDNDFYLHRAYDKTYSSPGSIFADANNQADFADANTILYGHHMKNGSMFAGLSDWAGQAYYEEHPVMWLLTPEQNYKIELFSGYTAVAGSDVYTIFPEAGDELNTYLKGALANSDFRADIELKEGDRYVLLSTCAYVFENARYVLHGRLVAVE